MLDDDRFRITFLDVSQGDSAVLELPGGEVVLIDGGASYERFDMGRSVVAPYLWNRGIRTIDYVIATHHNWIMWAASRMCSGISTCGTCGKR